MRWELLNRMVCRVKRCGRACRWRTYVAPRTDSLLDTTAPPARGYAADLGIPAVCRGGAGLGVRSRLPARARHAVPGRGGPARVFLRAGRGQAPSRLRGVLGLGRVPTGDLQKRR